MSAFQPQRVFLSYARADWSRAAKIAEALTATARRVWCETASESDADISGDVSRELDNSMLAWWAAMIGPRIVCDDADTGRDRNLRVNRQVGEEGSS